MKYLVALLMLPLVACSSMDPDSEVAQGRKLMGLQEKFDRFDYDGNGKLSRAEIEEGVAEAGVTGVSEEEIIALMDHYDLNKDGEISRWESERAIESPLPAQP